MPPVRPTLRKRPLFMSRLTLLLPLLLGLLVSEVRGEESPRPSFLPEKLEDARGKKMDSAALKGKFIGLYFSASWCGPCRAFTPMLKEFRARHLEEGFEVVLVNFDKTNTEKRRYIKDSGMEWPSIVGARRKPSQMLAETYDVTAYPTLIVVAPDGNVVTRQGVEAIYYEPETAFAVWKDTHLVDE